jgi:CheY-like chemotaxis protein
MASEHLGEEPTNKHFLHCEPGDEAASVAKLLLVEDMSDDQRLVIRALRGVSIPMVVTIAGDGREATKLLGLSPEDAAPETPPDLVVCDLKMPFMRGDEVLAQFRSEARYANVPFVVFSSSSEQSDIDRCLSLGATDFCVKPVDFREFIQCVCDIARRWLAPKGSDPDCLIATSEDPGTDNLL